MFHGGAGELGSDYIVVGLQGHELIQRLCADHNARRVGGSVPGHSLQHLGIGNEVGYAGIVFDGVPQLPVGGNGFFKRHFFGNHGGKPIALGGGEAQDAGNILHHHPRRHGAEGDDLRNVIRAVFLGHIVNDLLPAFVAEVDVKVRHGHALGV